MTSVRNMSLLSVQCWGGTTYQRQHLEDVSSMTSNSSSLTVEGLQLKEFSWNTPAKPLLLKDAIDRVLRLDPAIKG